VTYAHRPDIFDADTHMMEPADWIASFADARIRPRLEPYLGGNAAGLGRVADGVRAFERRRADPEAASQTEAEFMAMKNKGWMGMGGFDAAERVRVNDLFGFSGSLIFPTSAFNQVVAAEDPEVLLGGVQALNRGLAAFCSADRRNFGAAYLPLALGPEVCLAELSTLAHQGFRNVVVDTIPPENGDSFAHPKYDPVWADIAGRGFSVSLHVGVNGGVYNPVPGAFYRNGGKVIPSHDGDAPRDALSYMAIQYNAELFLAAMIFDGVLERFPGLRIGVVELGASWIISWMKHLDQAYRAYRRLQDLSQVKLAPSEYVRRQIKVTPFPGEDIGWLLRTGAEDLLMFATDYPHHEGTDDPIGRFERTMDGIAESAKAKFYTDNFKAFMALN
jgi:uncharacterized protein